MVHRPGNIPQYTWICRIKFSSYDKIKWTKDRIKMAEEEINKLKRDLINLQGELDSLDHKIECPTARTILENLIKILIARGESKIRELENEQLCQNKEK